MRAIHFLATVLGCLLLASCFDIREEVWIESDGSGRAELDYVVPTKALTLAGGRDDLEETIREVFDSEPDLNLDGLTFEPVGEDTAIRIRTSTDSMLSLLDVGDNELLQTLPQSASGFAGDFDVALKGLNLSFSRTVDLGNTLGVAALAIGGEQREKRRVRYVIHLPKAPTSHDAPETADRGRTLIWDLSLGEALDAPVTTSFRARIPLPLWAVALAIVLVAGVVVRIVLIIRRRGRTA